MFSWWHRRLCRYLELRETNRHALMHFIACARHVATSVGSTLAASGVLQSRDDIFFLTLDEIKAVASGTAGDWQGIVAARREEWESHATQSVPDTVIGSAEGTVDEGGRSDGSLRGLPISAGYAEGPVCLLLSPNDMKKVKRGDILVAPVIDPGMAPLMGLAAGLVVEMGGTLSHGAIIAREYGLPALANVQEVTHLLKDGERVAVDATAGEIKRLKS
jgi:pyruvate,water dikinase